MEFRIAVLGPVQAYMDGQPCDLGTPKQKLVLAALAWDVGRTVGRDTLIRRVWGDDPPGRPEQNLQSYVARVRKALGPTGKERLLGADGGYRLDAHPDRVDAHHHVTLTDQARALADNGSFDAALALLREARTLRRGETLAGLPGGWAQEVRARVHDREIRVALLEASITLRLGRHHETVARLQALTDDAPDDESLVAHLALALHGAGRDAEALRLLHRTAHRLRRRYGTGLSVRLQSIRRGIDEGVPDAELLTLIGVSAAAGPPEPVPDNLPRGTPLVGRAAELQYFGTLVANVTDVLSSAVALEAIDGMGGVGKTTLAVQVGHQLRDRFPDGRIFLALLGHDPAQPALAPENALRELLRLIGVPQGAVPSNLDQLAALWRQEMSRRRVLVILDDALNADQVEPLLPGASPSLVIITSRRRLAGLSGVRSLALDVLPEDEAVALFRRQLPEHQAADREEVARVVRLCSYLPLAIDIAACRLLTRPAWTTTDLADRLASSPTGRLDEFRDGTRGLVDAFSMSYRVLTTAQKRFFRIVGLYPGTDFGPHAAAALAGVPVDGAEHLLEELLRVNLFREQSTNRFSVHDLLREYARTLASRGEAVAAIHRLTETVLQAADLADRLAYPHRLRVGLTEHESAGARPDAARWLEAVGHRDWFTVEGRNLLALLEHLRAFGPARSHALLTHVLAGFLENEGYLLTALPHLKQAVEHWERTGEDGPRTRALLDLSAVHTHVGDYEEALRLAAEAVEIARAIGDIDAEMQVLHHTGTLHWHTGHYREAVLLQRHVLRLRQQYADDRQVARSLNLLGVCLLHLGKWQEARQHFRHAVVIFSGMGDKRGLYRTLNNLSELMARAGRRSEALVVCQQALALARPGAGRAELALLHSTEAKLRTMLGDTDQSLILYREALPVIRSGGELLLESVVLNGLGISLRVAGQVDEALPHHATALALARRIHAPNEEMQALRELGHVEYLTGRHEQAVGHAEEALEIARRLASPDEVAVSLSLLACLKGHLGFTADAERLRREASVFEAGMREQLAELD
ncbi:AfsR/SARP family transcriptional regulator [Streptomyces avicenniae]|uniref:AfsR/SARP family transcriptional regulator n=1 Tax=Streptomyces avicenniae TaxID=500153 RepID=UPI00069A11CF|nr:tetratricopeptide repeat protein [Streptomyces avicenniae]